MDADEVIKIELSSTCECGGEVTISNKPYIHQKVDLPIIKPYVVEYQMAVVEGVEEERAANYRKVLRQIHLDQGSSL